MSQKDRLPAKSADLIALLDSITPAAAWPQGPADLATLDEAGMRKRIWAASQRAMVDALVEQLDAEALEEAQEALGNDEADPADRENDDPYQQFPRVLGEDGQLRPLPPSISVDIEGS